MAQVDFPDKLFEHVRTRSCVLCTGVRFAAAAGMPDWSALFEKLKDKLEEGADAVDDLLEQGKLLTLAGYLRRKLGQKTCTEVLTEAYGEDCEPSKIHKTLGELPFHGAVTTGYDTLLEQALSSDETQPRVYTHADGGVLRLRAELDNFVIKAHGDVEHGAAMVLSLADYKQHISPNKEYCSFMEDLYRTQPLLLVGYHADDPDLLLLLERLVGTFRESMVDHYAILPNVSALEAEDLYANHRIRAISYEEDADNPLESLAEVLGELRDRWSEMGEELPGPDDPSQQAQYIRTLLANVDVRLDVMGREGLQLSEGRLDSIRASAEKVELDSLDAETLCRLGNVNLILDDATRAVSCYEAALEADEEMAAAHLNLHHACAELGQFDDSLEHLSKAREQDETLWVVPERYEIAGVIGRGTSGTIYEAVDNEEDREVIVKVLRASYVREHVSPEKWLEETQTRAALEHDNLGTIHDALLEGGRCILITEHLKGKTLSEILRDKGMLAPDVAAEIMSQICKGLQHAHEEEILHLDITPSNIFVQEDGTAVLMDFRTGRAVKGRAVTVKRGSEGYQAPELLAGEGGDARADVYSLGAVLYTMATCKVPMGAFSKIAELNSAARRFDSLVARSLRATPDERPASVAEFAGILSQSSEEVVLPESEDDLEGWLEVLAYQPEHEQALEILQNLEQSFRDEDDWEAVIALLLGKGEVTVEAKQREEQLKEVSRIFEKELGDLAKAFPTLLAAFRENPSSEKTQQELERLAGATSLWNDLLQEYNNQVQTLTDPDQCCDLLVRMGNIYARELKLDDYAITSFNQALTREPKRADALYELAELYRRKEDHKERAKVLAKLADLEEDAGKKIEKLRDLAQLYAGELDSDEQAILSFRKILDVDAANAGAIAALEGLYRKSEMWDELAQLLGDRVEVTDDAEDLKRYRVSLAELLAEKLEQPEEAIEQYQELLNVDPTDSEALKGLEVLYESTGRNDDYRAILDKRIETAETDDQRVVLCRRMAAEWEGQEDGNLHASEYLEKIVEVNGGDDETFKALVRIYWALEDFSMLAEAYNRYIQITKKPEDRVGQYAALGKVYEDHLEQDGKAIETFNNLLSVDADSKIALSALVRLYQKTEVWAQTVEMLDKLITREEDVDAQADLFCQMGKLQHERMHKDDEAEINLVKALELKEEHVEARLVLAGLYKGRKDYGKAARMLHEAAQHTGNDLEKVARLYLSGVAYQEDLEDEDQALGVFEELMALDPEHLETGERLLAIYEKREESEKLETVLEMLVRKTDSRADKERFIDFNQRLGSIALDNENEERALTAFRAAYDADPTSQVSLQNLAGLLYKRDEIEEAAKLLQALLVHRRDTMNSEETVGVFFKLGDIKDRQGEKAKALNMFEKALDTDPTNLEVLERAVNLYDEKGDLDAVLRCRKKMLDSATEDEARMYIAEEIGDLLHEQLKRPNDAIKHYEIAREIKPDYRRVLHKIMEVYIEQRKWKDAVLAMGKIEDYETDATHRSRLHYTAAVIYRDELKQQEEAAHHFDQALVKDPSFFKAFEALKKLYTEQENYKKLAQAYHLMLQRLPEETSNHEKVTLWQELGDICQDKLQDGREAIVAYEVADKLDPTNEARQANLSRLYAAAGPSAYEKAVAVNYRLLKTNPLKLQAFKELRRLYSAMKQRDKAWCLAAVLSVLGKADDEEKALYAKHRNASPRQLSQKLTDELVERHVLHANLNRFTNAVFAGVAPVVSPMAAKPVHSYGLREAEELEPHSDTRPYAQVSGYMNQVLGTAPNRMFISGAMKEQLSLVLSGTAKNTESVLRVSPSVVKSDSAAELTFWFAKQYSLLRPELMLSYALQSTTVLQAVLLSVLKLVQPTARIKGETAEITKLSRVLKAELPAGRFDYMSRHTDSLAAAATPAAVQSWLDAVDLSCSRVALVLCDDLETAARLISIEPPAEGIGPKERMQQLISYAISEDYFKIREHLGLMIR